MTDPRVEYEEVQELLSDGRPATFYVVKLRHHMLLLTPGELARGLEQGHWYRRLLAERARAVREETALSPTAIRTYECGCTAGGNNFTPYCPMHGDKETTQ